jgi:energy-coupling factor transporter transmembrane protein EcfT
VTWVRFNSTALANFSELLAAQRFRCRDFENLRSRDASKMGQKFDVYLLVTQRLATNSEK